MSLQQAGSVKLLATGVTRQQPLLVTLGSLGFDGQLVLIIQSLHLQVLLLLICGLGHIQAELTSGGVAASGAKAVPVLLARADCQVHGRVLLQLLQCLHVLLQNDVPQVLQGWGQGGWGAQGRVGGHDVGGQGQWCCVHAGWWLHWAGDVSGGSVGLQLTSGGTQPSTCSYLLPAATPPHSSSIPGSWVTQHVPASGDILGLHSLNYNTF